MSTTGVGQRWPRFRGAAALVVLGLYFVGLIRLALSGNWHDFAASKIFALTLAVAWSLVLVSLGLHYGRPKKTWTERKRVIGFVVLGVILTGGLTLLGFHTTGWGQLFLQTVLIATALVFILE